MRFSCKMPDIRWKTYFAAGRRFSARKINALLGNSGILWQRDYFDRLVRDEEHFANCVRYIRHNPKKAGLRKNEYLLYESELAKQIE
jgi:putative transposase